MIYPSQFGLASGEVSGETKMSSDRPVNRILDAIRVQLVSQCHAYLCPSIVAYLIDIHEHSLGRVPSTFHFDRQWNGMEIQGARAVRF
jgi:hypothetical protein